MSSIKVQQKLSRNQRRRANQKAKQGKPEIPFRNQHAQFFQPRLEANDINLMKILKSAVENRKQSVKQGVTYVKQNAQHTPMKEFLRYRQHGLKNSVQKAAFQKTINSVMKSENVNRETAVLGLLYDDFISDMWSKGKEQVHTFWQNNKTSLLELLKAAVFQLAPKLLAIGGTQLKSQDPYAVDTRFLQTLFSKFETSQCPRQTIDPLAVFKNQSTYPIISGSSGQCTVVINPYGMFYTALGVGPAMPGFPFIAVSSSNTNLVYNGATVSAGPFVSQVANIQGFFPDQCKVAFMCTQSTLNAAGKVTCSVYYSPPNPTLELGTLQTVNGLASAITASQQLNARQATVVKNVPEALHEYLDLVRWIPTSNDFNMDLISQVNDASGAAKWTNVAFLVLNFEGLTPSTNVGQIYVSTCASFKPVSNLGGLYDTSIRGGFEGTHRLLHQLRKKRIKVNFQAQDRLSKYIVQNFANLEIGSSTSRSQGSGFCVDEALKAAGFKTFGRPWITIKQIQSTYPGLFKYVYTNQVQEQGLYINVTTAHAFYNSCVEQIVQEIDYVQGICLDGRSFATDLSLVYFNPPYSFKSFSECSSVLHAAKCTNGKYFDYTTKTSKEVGLVTPRDIYPIIVNFDPLFYDGQFMIVEKDAFWVKGKTGVDKYDFYPFQKLRYFLSNYVYSLTFSLKEKLLRQGVQPNPGPSGVQTRAIVPKSAVDTGSVCYECAFKTALLMQYLARGKDSVDLERTCSTHSESSSSQH